MAQFPMTLTINNEQELDALRRALNVQFEVENDCVLDDVVSSATKFRSLQEQSDCYIDSQLHTYRQDTSNRIDGLVAMTILRERVNHLK